MQQKKFKEKYNDGCIKIFKLLQLLYEDKAYYDDVIAIFSGNETETEKQHVTLNKYLNTLKVFGMKIEKNNKKFEFQNLPFSMKFDIDDLKAISMFSKISESLPNGRTQKSLKQLVKLLKSRFDANTAIIYDNISLSEDKVYDFYHSSLRTQIELCENYCNSEFKLYVTYIKNNEEVSVYCNAKEVIFDNKNAYFRIYKIHEQEIEDILISKILSVKYAPTQKTKNEVTKTVVFRLKGRLAKVYTLKENEYINEYCEDGSIVVVNTGEPMNNLLKRLIRYNSECVIEGPKELRQRMVQLIDDTLQNYV